MERRRLCSYSMFCLSRDSYLVCAYTLSLCICLHFSSSVPDLCCYLSLGFQKRSSRFVRLSLFRSLISLVFPAWNKEKEKHTKSLCPLCRQMQSSMQGGWEWRSMGISRASKVRWTDRKQRILFLFLKTLLHACRASPSILHLLLALCSY